MKKKDFIFLLATALTIFIVFIIWTFYFKQGGDKVVITVDGIEYGVYDLDDSMTVPITVNGHTGNVLKIENGYAYMESADCPDGTCMRQGKIQNDGQTIICLPHKIVVKTESINNSKTDTMTN